MENKIYFIWITLCLIAFIIRTSYEILKYLNKIIPGKISFMIIFSNMALLWTSWLLACSNDPVSMNLPVILRYAGLFLVISGVIIFLVSLLTIKTLESYEGNLITKGIYSKIRHPMYLSFIFWLSGLPVFIDAFISFLISFLFISNVLYWRYLEEIELVKRFSEYKEYRKSTLF